MRGQGQHRPRSAASPTRSPREEPFAAHFTGWQGPWNYAAAEETEDRLRGAGFSRRVLLDSSPSRSHPADARAFTRTVCLVRHLDHVPAELHPRFLDRVLERAGEPLVLDYVRLNMTATAA